jgi:hypothetical protein
MPAPWQYTQRRLNEAHNAQMRHMYEHPPKFSDEVDFHPGSTNAISK